MDMGCDVKYLYSDWNPEKVVENFKQAVAASPDGIVLMGLPGNDALEPFIKEAFDKGIRIAGHPDCKMILVDHGALTSQMENFLKTAGIKPGEIFVGGFSLSPATANSTAIENGYVNLVSEMQPYLLGYLSVAQIVLTKRYGFTGLEIDTGGGLVDKDNIGLLAPLAKKGIR